MPKERMNPDKLSGPEKAAIFFLTMGEEYTASFFKTLDEENIRIIGTCMSDISYVPAEVLQKVMNEFIDNFESNEDLLISGRSVLEKVLANSVDEETAREVIRLIGSKDNEDPFRELSYMPSETLLNVIKNEHPQTIALILSQLPQDKAGEILSMLNEDIKADVALRMVQMSQVPGDVIEELKEAIKKDISKIGRSTTKRFDGVEKLANILNDVDRKTEEQILTFIEQEDTDLAEKIRQKMFIFEDLLHVDEKGFREILQNVDNQTVAKALKTATEEMKQKVFANLSSRASEMLREDMEVLGPVRLREVEESQQIIIKAAKRLESEGKVVIGNKGKDDVLV